MVMRLVDELSRQGVVEPRLFARRGTALRSRAAKFAAAVDLTPALTNRRLAHLVKHWMQDIRALIRVVRLENPEVCVLADGCILEHPLFALTLALMRQKLIIYVPITEATTALGFRTGPVRDLIMKLGFVNLPHAWIVLTREQALSFASWTGVSRPIVVLPNSVAPHIEAMANSEERAIPDLRASRDLRILVLGRLDLYQKGLDLLLMHVERHADKLEGMAITLVGEGAGLDFIVARRSGSLPLAKLLRIEPWSDPIEVMRSHEVLLLPSRFEGVPLVMLEAMALGLPVVASDLPGTREFLPATCLFPVGDLHRAFEQVNALRDPLEANRIAARNRLVFAERASGSAFSSAVDRLTRSLAGADAATSCRPQAR
jgi:glycosyltransferase involved in cell wall biosynthesis